MEYQTTIDGTSATIALSGNLTVATTPQLEAAFADLPETADATTSAPMRAAPCGGFPLSAEALAPGSLQARANGAPSPKPTKASRTIELKGSEKYFS